MPEFNSKFSSIEKLTELCKNHNIRIKTTLLEDIVGVRDIYAKLPSSLVSAKEGLESN
jgi:hypothetical protein